MKRFCILGYPRSGLTYTSLVFSIVGFYCLHERDESVLNKFLKRDKEVDGLTTGLFVSCSRDLSKYELIYHQVRYPLDVISSAQVMCWRSMQDMMETCGIKSFKSTDSKLYRVMRTWLAFTEWADAKAFMRYRVEDLPARWYEILEPQKIRVPFPPRLNCDIHKLENHIPPARTWQDLLSCDQAMTFEIMAKTVEYGYCVDHSRPGKST